MIDITPILKRLKQARKQAGFTQARTAAALGCVQSHIHDLENGLDPLTVVWLLRLCAVYGVEPSVVLSEQADVETAEVSK